MVKLRISWDRSTITSFTEFREAEMVERFGPVSVELNDWDAFFMGHKQVSSGVQKTHGVNRMRELYFSNELFVSSPEPQHAISITGHQ
jgi:hypothetical protein